MAYHFSASIPRVPTHSVLLPRSRLSAPPTAIGQSAERPGLLEFLRELAFEKCLPVDPRFHGPSFRIGLAATPWQLQQSLNLLQRQSLPNPLSLTSASGMTDANLDRVVALAMNTSLNTPFSGALATIWLRRDGPSGLPQDNTASGHQALNRMREAGKRLVSVEALAFDEQAAPLKLALQPMMHALQGIVADLWGSTDIVTSCPRSQAAFYTGKLGFSRLTRQGHEGAQAAQPATVMLQMPTRRKGQEIGTDSTEALSA